MFIELAFFLLEWVCNFTNTVEYFMFPKIMLLDVADYQFWSMVINIPWSFVYVWGRCSDSLGNRHRQLILLTLLGSLCWIPLFAIHLLPNPAIIFLFFLTEICPSYGFILIDTWMFREKRGGDETIILRCKIIRLFSRTVSNATGAFIYHYTEDVRIHFTLQMLFTLSLTLLVASQKKDVEYQELIEEKEIEVDKEKAKRDFRFFILYRTLAYAIPNADGVLVFFETGPLKIDAKSLAKLAIWIGCMEAIGLLSPFRDVIVVTLLFSILGNINSIPPLLLTTRLSYHIGSDLLLIYTMSTIGSFMISMLDIAFIEACEKASDKGKEGSIIGMAGMIILAGGSIGNAITYILTEYVYQIRNADFHNLSQMYATTSYVFILTPFFPLAYHIYQKRCSTPPCEQRSISLSLERVKS